MEFHNQQEYELLTGHADGSVALWDVRCPPPGAVFLPRCRRCPPAHHSRSTSGLGGATALHVREAVRFPAAAVEPRAPALSVLWLPLPAQGLTPLTFAPPNPSPPLHISPAAQLAEPSGGDQLLMEQPFASRHRASSVDPSVTKVTWGPDCSFFGVSFTTGVFQVWILSTEAKQAIHLDVEAHVGPVTDMAFTVLQGNQQLSVVTGGEDGEVKVWNARRGDPVHAFRHGSPVTCVCPGFKSRINYVFASYRDGNIKARAAEAPAMGLFPFAQHRTALAPLGTRFCHACP